MNGERPLTLSPTYRYKKDTYNHVLTNQMVKQVSSPSAKANDAVRNVHGGLLSNEVMMHPTPGGATPTSMLSHNGPNGMDFSR